MLVTPQVTGTIHPIGKLDTPDPGPQQLQSLNDCSDRAPSSFGFMPGVAGASSFGSFFSSTPSTTPATDKTAQPQQDGSFFSGFKGLSAGIFHKEGPARKEEQASMFGKKFSFPWQIGSEAHIPESPPLLVTCQPIIQGTSLSDADNGFDEPEKDQHLPDSDSTEGPDPNDTDEPTDTSGQTGSMDRSPGSNDTLTMQSGIPSEAMSPLESLDKVQFHVTLPEVCMNTPSTDPNAAQPMDSLLKNDLTKRLVMGA
ncbi:hypothetical protein DPEC_G00119710 [Dallia pectoralis]|uniref:Uncharacterized protein n=1 Tax=Dallia pectoralis TaxID=75939 RepID=A0ACC2GPI2_DALPE|nr:hypothetical protein DPEC_G00119710 [Dallia pectoralis]